MTEELLFCYASRAVIESCFFNGGRSGTNTGQNATKGSAPVMNLTYHEPTNRINSLHGFSYDANGNVTAMPGMTNTYDAANRLTQVVHNSTGDAAVRVCSG